MIMTAAFYCVYNGFVYIIFNLQFEERNVQTYLFAADEDDDEDDVE